MGLFLTTQTLDIKLSRRALRRENLHFEKVRRAEIGYAVQLRKIARHVGDIIRAYTPGDRAVIPELMNVLSRYSDVIGPWANSVANRMIAEVSRRDEQAWFKTASLLSTGMRSELRNAPIGDVIRRLLSDQVNLITSIPLEAGQRIQQLTQELVTGGRRYDEIIPMIVNSSHVTISRATLIARTETAKAASAFTQARALHIGSTHYTWHTAMDYKVRKAHKRLQGKVFAWDDPPIAELNGDRHHPGDFPNCRCFAAPILDGLF